MTTQHQSLADLIEDSLQQHADAPAFSCLGQTLTFADIDAKSKALAAWLQAHPQLQPGDRIAIQLPNVIQYPISVYAALRAELVIVNINPLYTPAEMAHQLKDSGAKAIIILDDLLGKLQQIQEQTAIDLVLATKADDLLSGNGGSASESVLSFNQCIEEGLSLALQKRKSANSDDVCVLQYTGGTTGVSKGAMLTNNNLLSNAQQTIERLGARCGVESEIFVCPLPLYHIYAFTVNMIAFASRGNLNILIPNPRDVTGFINAIKPFKFTGFSGINTLFVGLCQVPDFKALDFSALHLTISGGSALTTTAAKTWFDVTGCTISEGYGLSETSPVLCLNTPGEEQIGTVGLPLKDTEIQLWNEQNQAVTDGDEGEIVIRGPQVMLGYWQRKDETAKVITDDGFFKTGDVGVRLPSGHIKIVDRLKDMIIVSGFNVYPNEIEDVLVQHPAVLEAAVIGEVDDKTGEKVCAYITTTSAISNQEIIDFCKLQLTNYKVPKKVVILDELPKSSVGKILRRKLR
ncbi:AMP-binding protein [Thalassotalea litorea]|uniref:AMP-binding protein n=1 Tax=Thalassotalea litorea TaxID=2020715 RepID=UPI003735313E